MLLDPRDPKDEASNAIFEFIEEALEATESVLVHSVRGQSRATCALACYIMRKYKWSLLKSLEFLNNLFGRHGGGLNDTLEQFTCSRIGD